MIFTQYENRLFYIDLLLHLLFSFTIATIIFIIRFRKERKEKIDKKIKKVLNSNIVNEISNPTTLDKSNLDILDSIYVNRDNFDKTLNTDLKKASYNQIIIFVISIFTCIYFIEKKSELINLFLDKIITFVILGSTIYLYSLHFKSKYSEVTEKFIYDVFKKSNDELTNSTTY